MRNRRKQGRNRGETKERTCIKEEVKDGRKDVMKPRKNK
jgi:hypothetical protein